MKPLWVLWGTLVAFAVAALSDLAWSWVVHRNMVEMRARHDYLLGDPYMGDWPVAK